MAGVVAGAGVFDGERGYFCCRGTNTSARVLSSTRETMQTRLYGCLPRHRVLGFGMAASVFVPDSLSGLPFWGRTPPPNTISRFDVIPG